MSLFRRGFLWVAGICLLASAPYESLAQSASQPVVFSQTIIGIVPGNTVPKAISQSPELQTPAAAEDSTSDSTEQMIAAATGEKLKLRVQVRGDQIPLDRGIYTSYRLDEEHGVLTYFPDSGMRQLIAENIHKPVDVLFVREDGVIAQIVPEIVLAYLPEGIEVDFPLKALLYLNAGLAAQWNIQPGYRIEHGMFKPTPLIYKVEP